MSGRFDPFTIFNDGDPGWIKIGVAAAIILVPSKFVVTEPFLWYMALAVSVLFSLSDFLGNLRHLFLIFYASMDRQHCVLTNSVPNIPEYIVQVFDAGRFIKRISVNFLCLLLLFLIGGLIWNFGPSLVGLLLAKLAGSQ